LKSILTKKISKLIFNMKVMLVSNMDYSGAGNAAIKILKMLQNNNLDCELFVNKKKTKFSSKFSLSKKEQVAELTRKFFYYTANRLINLSNKSYYKSIGIYRSVYPKKINNSDFDIVQLHWINGFLSIGDIIKIKKPIVWRFSDFWPSSGIYHYENNKDIKSNFLLDNLNTYIKYLKKDLWKKNITIVTPSDWMRKQIEKSNTFQNYSIEVIQTPIDDNIFKKIDKLNCKKKHGVSLEKKILLFGAENINDPRKGFHDLIKVFQEGFMSNHNFELLTFGFGKLDKNRINNLEIKNLGFINSKEKLNEIYNCADLMIVASRMDNLPQVGLEAQMSGLPLIVYNNSGLSELVENFKTGLIAEDQSISSLAKQIELFFGNEEFQKNFSGQSIIRAKKKFSENIIFEKYDKIYNKTLEGKV